MHELVLNGIGGRTVEEAALRLSAREFEHWMHYRRKHGPLNGGLRGDRQTALLCLTVARLAGAKSLDLYDFLPFESAPAPQPQSLEEAIKQWS